MRAKFDFVYTLSKSHCAGKEIIIIQNPELLSNNQFKLASTLHLKVKTHVVDVLGKIRCVGGWVGVGESGLTTIEELD